MTSFDEQGEKEKAAAEEFLRTSEPFEGIEGFRVELGEDHTGDPSMWVVFQLRPELNADDRWIKAFSRYSSELLLKLLATGQTRFPYKRMERAA